MTGCIFKRKLRSGLSWGFSIFGGYDESGKQVRVFKSGFPTKDAAETACKDALKDSEARYGKISRDVGTRGRRIWAFTLGEICETGFTSRADAEAALRTAIEKRATEKQRQLEQVRAREELTLQRYLPMWINDHAARRCSGKTIERYLELAQYLVRELGSTPLNELTPAQIQQAVHNLHDRGGAKTKEYPPGRPLAAKTVRHIGSLLYTALAEAGRLGLLKIPHPMANKRVLLPKLVKRKPAVLDPEKLGQLFPRARGTRLYALLVLAADTGCRRGELLPLRWSDINLESREVTIARSLEQTKKSGLRVKSTKSGEPRSIVISEWALEVLKEHRQEQDSDRQLLGRGYHDQDLVFCQPTGAYYSPDRLGARVAEMMRKAGLQGVSLHSLRHSYASIAISRGVPIPAVSERLGHADQNITLSIYSHALSADKRAAANIWSDAMADVIAAARKPRAPGTLANVCRKGDAKNASGSFKRRMIGGDDGVRTRDLRRDRPAF